MQVKHTPESESIGRERRVIGAILVAAGQSRRMGFDKIFRPLTTRSALELCLERLSAFPRIFEIVVVVARERREEAARLIAPLALPVPVEVVEGGAERQDSVESGLRVADPRSHFALVHDAARPFVTGELIEAIFQVAQREGAAACGNPSADTVKEVDEQGNVVATLDRRKVWNVQTPQIFRRELLLEAYRNLREKGKSVTDDAAAVEAIGHPVRLVSYSGFNGKMTRPEDWELARQLLLGKRAL
ncbi:2-C-methyl-D-erythritol 4-phosphate cytidylyltransferase [Methylacidimicrobium tartarophylax]|uniref:2-C-methyl-D-erythritol 4-phosphate cytidylyltransferase n=1 Tax=Methylacidimicrobium tartarophylax TaxID=1041768 RepID=A0A5E6MGL8_9BACT|nr:2-C-methyl-D-erythritol 4-phosphate cytidylyltransferase [Methylacidimicrobium tartarophylax]VVM05214.1 2-C-methyl-D-erythritol 4-phosphate cytidylyltransferase [Methylacidimicrobium tartarophylax]